MTIRATLHDGDHCPESTGDSRSNIPPETPNKKEISDPNSPDASTSSPTMTTKKLGTSQDGADDIPTLIVATPDSTSRTESSGHTNTKDLLSTLSVPPLMPIKNPTGDDAKAMPLIPPCRPLQLNRHETNDSSTYFSSPVEVSTNAADGATAKSSSSFACLDEFSDDDSSRSTSSSSTSISKASSSSSSTASKSDSSIMSSASSSSDSLISKCSTLSDDSDAYDEDKASGESTSIFASLVSSSSNTSSSGVGMSKKASTAWLHRRERMQTKKHSAVKKKTSRRESMKLRSRDRFLRNLAMKGEADYSYLKENEMRARNATRGSGTGPCLEARRHILFELYYSVPAAITMLAFCCTHVAIYEFFQIAVADCLELNEYYNQTLVYICVFAVAVLLARISGSLYEFTSDDAYNNIKFDMKNKLKLGDLDAFTLRLMKKHPKVKLLLDVTALYLIYISANHFMTETMLKNFFDSTEDVLEGLPSMKYPGISTHISNILVHGEEMFENPSLVLGEETSAESSTACAVLGGDICDERVFQACNTLDEFRANLTVADGEYLYDEVRLCLTIGIYVRR